MGGQRGTTAGLPAQAVAGTAGTHRPQSWPPSVSGLPFTSQQEESASFVPRMRGLGKQIPSRSLQ